MRAGRYIEGLSRVRCAAKGKIKQLGAEKKTGRCQVPTHLVKSKDELKDFLSDLVLGNVVCHTSHVRDHLGQQAQGVQVLDNVARAVGDEQQIQIVERLVKIAHALRLHVRVLLRVRPQELGESAQEALDANASHLHELARDERLAALRHDCRRQYNHFSTRAGVSAGCRAHVY